MPRRIATMATTTISSVMENPPCRLMRRNVPECDGRHAGVKSHRGGDPTDGRWRPTDGSHPDVRAGHGPLERWNARTHRATFQRTGRGERSLRVTATKASLNALQAVSDQVANIAERVGDIGHLIRYRLKGVQACLGRCHSQTPLSSPGSLKRRPMGPSIPSLESPVPRPNVRVTTVRRAPPTVRRIAASM